MAAKILFLITAIFSQVALADEYLPFLEAQSSVLQQDAGGTAIAYGAVGGVSYILDPQWELRASAGALALKFRDSSLPILLKLQADVIAQLDPEFFVTSGFEYGALTEIKTRFFLFSAGAGYCFRCDRSYPSYQMKFTDIFDRITLRYLRDLGSPLEANIVTLSLSILLPF